MQIKLKFLGERKKVRGTVIHHIAPFHSNANVLNMQDIESSDISCHNFPENEAESPYLRVFKYLSERPSLLRLKLVLIALAALQRYVIGPPKYHDIFSTNQNYDRGSRPFSRVVHRLHVLEM